MPLDPAVILGEFQGAPGVVILALILALGVVWVKMSRTQDKLDETQDARIEDYKLFSRTLADAQSNRDRETKELIRVTTEATQALRYVADSTRGR